MNHPLEPRRTPRMVAAATLLALLAASAVREALAPR